MTSTSSNQALTFVTLPTQSGATSGFTFTPADATSTSKPGSGGGHSGLSGGAIAGIVAAVFVVLAISIALFVLIRLGYIAKWRSNMKHRGEPRKPQVSSPFNTRFSLSHFAAATGGFDGANKQPGVVVQPGVYVRPMPLEPQRNRYSAPAVHARGLAELRNMQQRVEPEPMERGGLGLLPPEPSMPAAAPRTEENPFADPVENGRRRF